MSRTIVRKKKRPTKAIIIHNAAKLFAQRGYHATTMAEIAKQSYIGKTGVFNHFTSKHTLFLEVIQLESTYCHEQLFQLIYAKDHSVQEKVHHFLDRVYHYFTHRSTSALIVSVTTEAVGLPNRAKLEQAIQHYCDIWLEAIRYLLDSVQKRKAPLLQAMGLFSQMQGALLLARFSDKPNYIEVVCSTLQEALWVSPNDLR